MRNSFRFLCLVTLVWTLFVILWGAFTRFSHSGDGCGKSWPQCLGEWLPRTAAGETWIEWIHRASTVVFGFLVLLIFFFGFHLFKKGKTEKLILFVLVLLSLFEALIGAGLVLGGLTGSNDSLARLFVLNIHTMNSLCLISCPALLWRLSFEECIVPWRRMLWPSVLIFLLFVLGSMTSLSNTLFPSSNLLEGLAADFSSGSHFMVRLRILHPLAALIVFGLALHKMSFLRLPFHLKNTGLILAFFLCITFLSGLFTLLNLSPLWLKMSHLFFAYLLWLLFIMFFEREKT